VISSWQRSKPDYAQHLQQTHIHVPVGIRNCNPASELPQTYALDRAATGIGGRNVVKDKWEGFAKVIVIVFFVNSYLVPSVGSLKNSTQNLSGQTTPDQKI
jgi:hypothetical protein